MEHDRRAAARKRRYQKKNAGERLHVLLFYILPFLVFNSLLFYCVTAKPSLEVQIADTKDYLSTEITIRITSLFPSQKPVATADGEALELTKTKGRTYTASVYKNGSIEASVTNLNGMTSTVFEQVNILDDNPPSVEEANIIDGILTLKIADSQSGVNFSSVYALDASNERVEPVSFNRDTNTFSYEMTSNTLQIFAQDRAGNEVHSNLTAHKEGTVETSEENLTNPDVSVE
ncbi:MAG: hypothetical protein MR868_08335 [Lachnospiraceae bacterium]|nr:hypothetical protein [Lachnospiraceae bacterium]